MAVDLSALVAEVKQPIQLEELSGKRVAIDAFNTIYQFLSIIRQRDGSPLVDSKNQVTSHLSGLFYRTISLIEKGVVPIFVFDGIPPYLKKRTLEARMNRRNTAFVEWKKAKENGKMEEARIHAMASTRINKQIIEGSKELMKHMGIPFVQAPGEGEAQAAYMVKQGMAYAAGSQDYDLFLFGADRVVRNLTITGKRKLPRKNVYIDVNVERIFLEDLLNKLEINQSQLIMLGMLVGTDFNQGIKGVGAKTALKIVKERKTIDEVLDYVSEKYQFEFDVDPGDVERVFMEPDVLELDAELLSDEIKTAKPDKEAILKFMCDEHEFGQERIEKYIDKLLAAKGATGQKGINNWM